MFTFLSINQSIYLTLRKFALANVMSVYRYNNFTILFVFSVCFSILLFLIAPFMLSFSIF